MQQGIQSQNHSLNSENEIDLLKTTQALLFSVRYPLSIKNHFKDFTQNSGIIQFASLVYNWLQDIT